MSKARDAAAAVVAELQRRGHTAVFAGGCVRDEILGQTPKDYDVATSALPDEVEAAFPKTLAVGKAFGIIVVVKDDEHVEVATLRADGQYGDGRRPDSVEFVSSLGQDAARRDFTINAMFKDPVTDEIFDFFGGREDLEAGLIRSVGDAHARIGEDRLRMLRAPRFAARYGFAIDEELAAAIRQHASELCSGEKRVSFERIRYELSCILTSANPLVGLDFMMESGLMAACLPEIVALTGPKSEQDPVWHPEGNVWVHTRMVLDILTGSHFELMLGGLLHDIGKPDTQKKWPTGGISNHGHAEVGATMAEAMCRRLKLSNAQITRVTEMVRLHMKMHVVPEMRPGRLARLLEREDIHDLIALQHADSTGNGCTCGSQHSNRDFLLARLDEMADRLREKPLVTGDTLIGLGFTPGPAFKEMLEEALAAQREGEFSTSAEGEAWARKHFLDGEDPVVPGSAEPSPVS